MTQKMTNSKMLMIASKVFPDLIPQDIKMVGSFLEFMKTYDLVHDEELLLFCHMVMGEAVDHVRKVELGKEAPGGKYGNSVKALLERFGQ